MIKVLPVAAFFVTIASAASAADNLSCSPFPPPPPDRYGRYPDNQSPVANKWRKFEGGTTTGTICADIKTADTVEELGCFIGTRDRPPYPDYRCPLNRSCEGLGIISNPTRTTSTR